MIFDRPDELDAVEQQWRVEDKVDRKPVGAVAAGALALAISMALWLVIYVAVLAASR